MNDIVKMVLEEKLRCFWHENKGLPINIGLPFVSFVCHHCVYVAMFYDVIDGYWMDKWDA